MTLELLDNIVWHSLAGPQAAFTSGTNAARRYQAGFAPIIGFEDARRPDFAALAPYCELDTHFYCGGWSGPAPSGWQIVADSAGYQMLWDAAALAADDGPVAVQLGPEHVTRMQALVCAAELPLFAQRSIELGEYVGAFEGGQLIAMAGERMTAGDFREISAVCTHPQFRGRGHARRLVLELVRRQMRHGVTPFLHVMRDNHSAVRLYEHMGFRLHQEVALRTVQRTS
jgi:ribosomal protein S18 acetylase RimI-like enzyme